MLPDATVLDVLKVAVDRLLAKPAGMKETVREGI